MSRAGFNLAEVPLRPLESGSTGGSDRASIQTKPEQTKPENLETETQPEQESVGLPEHSSDRPTVQTKFEGIQCNVDEANTDPLKTFSVIQTKLAIGQPGDRYEQEADRTAAQVMRMPDPQADQAAIAPALSGQPQIQRKCSQCEAEEEQPSIQRKEEGDRSEPASTAPLESRLSSQRGKGSALPEGVRSFMEPRFGNDFSGVRVHTDSSAVQMNKELGAQAFTHENDIYFNAGKYNPGSSGGRELLAHELTHTVQQTGGVQFKPEVTPINSQTPAHTPQIQKREQPGAEVASNGANGSHFLWRMVQTKKNLHPMDDTEEGLETTEESQASPTPPDAPTDNGEGQPNEDTPNIQAKCSQCDEETIQREPITPIASGDETVQAAPEWMEATGEWLGDRGQDIVEFGGDVVDSGQEFLGDIADVGLDLVARLSPELADLIRQDPIEVLKETVGESIKDWFEGLLDELGISDIVDDFRNSFDNLFATVRLIMEGDPETCEAVADKLNSMTEFVRGVMDNPKIQALQDAFTQAGEIFQQILDVFVAPVFNTIMDLVGDAFQGITDFGRQIWEWSKPVRDFVGDAWNWVMEQLGIGGGDGDSEGGLINWVKDKASEAWESIKETLDPVIEPIRNVVMVAVALSPITWIAAAVKYAPQVIEMVKWLWENRNNPNIVESAHEEMGHTILPQLLTSLQGFGDGLQSAVDTIITEVTKISDGFISLVSSLTGLPLLNMIKGTMETISNGVRDFVTWSRDKFESISRSVVEFAQKIQEKIRPWIEVLTSIAAVILNPGGIPGLLLGHAWMALPDCYKGPIIDFLLDTLIEILSGMPDFPFFGVLWPFLKQGVLGFLQGLRAQATDVKVAISNKIAKIISGSSPDFALGFVRGFLRGIWEGITDPFVLIYEGITAINDFKDWLNRSDEEGRSQADSQTGSTPAQQSDSSRQTDQTTQDTDSTRSGRGGAGPLQEAGMNILEIVIDRLMTMASELEAPSNEVTTNFLTAAQEVFTGAGEDITFEDVMDMMGEVREQVMTAIGNAGGQIATQVCEFMMQDEAESQIGDGAGWLTGTIVLELVLAYFTAGASTVASSVVRIVRQITNVLDRSGPAMQMVSNGMNTLGQHVDEILSSVRNLFSRAGDKASTVMDNLGIIGDILRQYGDEFLELLMGGVPIPGGDRRRDRGADTESGAPGQPRLRDGADSSTESSPTPTPRPTPPKDRDPEPEDTRTPELGGTPPGRTGDGNDTPTRTPEPTRPGVPRDRTPDGDETPTDSPRRPRGKDEDPTDNKGDDDTPDSPAYHQSLIRQAIRELEQGEPKDYDTVRRETERKAREVERRYTRRLRRGIRLSVYLENPSSDKQDSDLDFRVEVAPNKSEKKGARPFVDFEGAKEELRQVVASSETTEEVKDRFRNILEKYNLEEIEWQDLGKVSVKILLKSNLTSDDYQNIRAFKELILNSRPIDLEQDPDLLPGTIDTPSGSQTVGKRMITYLNPDALAGPTGTRLEQVMRHLISSSARRIASDDLEDRGEERINAPVNSSSIYVAGHLLNRRLGGPNGPENLYPITQEANDKHSERVEETVIGWKQIGYWSKYTVSVENESSEFGEPPYQHLMTVDSDFVCKAFVLDAAGQPGQSIDPIDARIESRFESDINNVRKLEE